VSRFQLDHEEFDAEALAARLPGYRLPPGIVAILQPAGGFLLPERCVVAHVEAAQNAGADVRAREAVLGWDIKPHGVRIRTNRETYDAARLVVTAGAWTTSIATHTVGLLTPERCAAARSRIFQVGRFSVFYIRDGEGFYGFPIYGVPGMKIGKYHHRGGTVDPDTMNRQPDGDDERVLREGIRRFFPDADGPTMGMKTCLFTNTSDEHFIIDFLERDPRVAIAAGFSGHGFKFCSVVGEILADLALDGGTRHDISLFALNRFVVS
jgi:sarcosine oxidase